MHPDKTFIGRVERGFDFLGYHFAAGALRVAEETAARFVDRATRLYEQDREAPAGASRSGEYVKRWLRWAGAGLSGIVGSSGRGVQWLQHGLPSPTAVNGSVGGHLCSAWVPRMVLAPSW